MQASFPSKQIIIFIIVIILTAAIFTGKAFGKDFFRKDSDISGKIIDFDTKEPVPGVVIMAMWTIEPFRLTIEPKMEYYDYVETLSDNNGEFRIPGKNLKLFKDINPPKIEIFKSGYPLMYLQDLGAVFMEMSPFSRYIKRVDGKTIISFKKKTLEERKKSISRYQKVPFHEMEQGVPLKKYRLYTEELQREYQALGVKPYWEQNPQILRYKEGGVFPEKETAQKPMKTI